MCTIIKNNIQKYRKYRNLSQEDLAKELGITRTYLSKIENQRFPPSTEIMEKVCRVFGVSLGQMFYFEEDGGELDG